MSATVWRSGTRYRVGVAEKKLILPSQAAEIGEWLQAAGLNPGEFAWSEAPSRNDRSDTVSKLTHVPTGYFFLFDYVSGNEFTYYCSPGPQSATDGGYTPTWNQLGPYLKTWMASVKREVETPDPWSQFFSAADLIAEGQQQTADNTPFAEAEYHDAVRRLESVRVFLLERSDDDAAREGTNAKIDYLVAQARTAGRSQWFYMAMGVLLSEVVNRSLNSDEVRHVFELLVRGVQQLTGG